MSFRILPTFCATALLAAAPLGAQSLSEVELSTYSSFTRFDRSLGLDNGFGFGARLGIGVDAGRLPLQLETEFMHTGSNRAGADVSYTPMRLRVSYRQRFHESGTVLLGLGGVRTSYSAEDVETVDYGVSVSAGVRVDLTPRIALRIDAVTDYMGSPANETASMPNNWNSSVQLGLAIPVFNGVAARRPEVIKAVPAPDPAPVEPPPAPVDVNADSDADGVIDTKDRCAGTAAGIRVDGDGCELPADTDQDGVVDPRDNCPSTAAGTRVDVAGCPVESDTDGDGVIDSRDRCPGSAVGTVVDGTGCPPLFENTTRTITLRGVTFASGRADLVDASLAALDKVAAQLLESPDVRIEVAGHTDGVGSRSRNVVLSLQRAEAVRSYLISRGVTTERLVARGYGPDEPLGNNATAEGRAMNRRVELRRID